MLGTWYIPVFQLPELLGKDAAYQQSHGKTMGTGTIHLLFV